MLSDIPFRSNHRFTCLFQFPVKVLDKACRGPGNEASYTLIVDLWGLYGIILNFKKKIDIKNDQSHTRYPQPFTSYIIYGK